MKPWSMRAELILDGNLDVVEVELGGVRGVAAHLLDVLADGEARRALLDDERGEPVLLLLRRGRREDHVDLTRPSPA